jgi:DNA polymerase alpha subunit A
VREPTKGQNASWCNVEALVDDSKLISVCSGSRNLEAPPIVVMSLDIKTRVNKKQEHEIVMISALVHKDVLTDKPTPNEMGRNNIAHFTVGRSAAGPGLPGHINDQTRKGLQMGRQKGTNNLKLLGSSERGMLQYVMTQVSKYDPDCIVGHNILGHSMDCLMHRMSKLKVSNWSKIGRLNLSQFPRAYRAGASAKMHNFERLAVGRLVVDTYATAKELIRSEVEYTLKHLAKKFLKENRLEILPLDVPNYFQSCESLLHLQKHTENGCYLAMSLMFRLEMLPVTKQLTNLGGCLWSKTLSGGRAERIEYLLLHEFHRRKYIVPDKRYKKKGSGKRGKSKYAGGLVLEPKKGLYDKYVLLLDFNSLYPSIIQEYNICFTTVERQLEGQKNVDNSSGVSEANQKAAGGDGMSDFVVPDLPDLTGSNNSNGERDWAVLPTLLRTLIQRRSVVKKQLKAEKDPDKKSLLNNKQLALKLTANSMYGCLGFQNSRFYASPIAALVTGTGREILQNTCDLAQGMGYEVIYGDTDSIMIYTNSTDLDQVQEIGKKIKKEVNKMYRLLEIEIDGVYKTMLLLKKKKYAAIIVNNKSDGSHTLSLEKKGLDLVRRDWCQLSKDLGTRCLELIMSGKETEEVVEIIHQDCNNVAKQMRNNEVPLEKYSITKSLSKAPKDYPNAKNMPHVMVALGMVKAGRPVNVGDHIPYVICNEINPDADPSKKDSPASRAFHPDAVLMARERFEQEEQQGTSSSSSSSSSASSSASSSSSGNGENGAPKKGKAALTVDVEWYLSTQMLPPTERLCDPIEGTSRSILAEHFGLDAQKYATASYSGMSLDEDLIGYTPSTQMPDVQRYKDCKPFIVTCPGCKQSTSFSGIFNFVEDEATGLPEAKSGMICAACGEHTFSLPHMTNMLDMSIRQLTLEYYEGWNQCTESTCNNVTRQCSSLGGVCIVPQCGSNTVESFSAGQLYTQLKYYETLFDLSKYSAMLKDKLGLSNPKSVLGSNGEEQLDDFAKLKERVKSHLATSDYQWIRPTMWYQVFGGSASGSRGNKRVHA